METITVHSTRLPDGTVAVSFEYDPKTSRVKHVAEAQRSLTKFRGSLFTTVECQVVSHSDQHWELRGVMNPNGSDEAIHGSLAAFRDWVELIAGQGKMCCIDLAGFKPETGRPMRRRKNRSK